MRCSLQRRAERRTCDAVPCRGARGRGAHRRGEPSVTLSLDGGARMSSARSGFPGRDSTLGLELNQVFHALRGACTAQCTSKCTGPPAGGGKRIERWWRRQQRGRCPAGTKLEGCLVGCYKKGSKRLALGENTAGVTWLLARVPSLWLGVARAGGADRRSGHWPPRARARASSVELCEPQP